jgi:hypothetical protein
MGAETASIDASTALIDYLTGSEAGSHFKANGFEHGS